MPDISLLPKEYSRSVAGAGPGKNIGAILSVVFVFFVCALWGGLYFYKGEIKKRISSIDSEIEAIYANGNGERSQKLAEISGKTINLKKSLSGHIYSSNIFEFLEKNTLKTVQFSKLSFDASKNSLNLSGVTRSYADFSKQFTALRDAKETVKSIEVSSVNMTKTGVEFDLQVIFNSEILTKK